jgi:hypothetical protein
MATPSLTEALTAPCPEPVGDAARGQVRQRLIAGIGSLADRLAPGEPVVVTLPLLRKARAHPELLAQPEPPFSWKPVFVRRSLGLAIVDACVTGRFRAPLEAAGPVASEAVSAWHRTGWRTFHWEPWFAGLAEGARASVLADAVCWATSLWSSVAWHELPHPPQIGGVDDQWSCPTSRAVRLKGRSELRVELDRGRAWTAGSPRTERPMALVSVSGGIPAPSCREELAFLALVAAVRSPSRPVPARVVGLWPDAGAHEAVDIDGDLLVAAADRVVDVVDSVSRAGAASAALDTAPSSAAATWGADRG